MTPIYNRAAQILAGAALFVSGIAAGSLHERSAAAQNRFSQPKTVLHVVVYKFRDDVSNYDREKAINGIKDMAGKIPGIKNVWLKTERNQIRDFSGVYAIEFTSAEAAADYAESPVHEARSKTWQQQRENSLSFQISNQYTRHLLPWWQRDPVRGALADWLLTFSTERTTPYPACQKHC